MQMVLWNRPCTVSLALSAMFLRPIHNEFLCSALQTVKALQIFTTSSNIHGILLVIVVIIQEIFLSTYCTIGTF